MEEHSTGGHVPPFRTTLRLWPRPTVAEYNGRAAVIKTDHARGPCDSALRPCSEPENDVHDACVNLCTWFFRRLRQWRDRLFFVRFERTSANTERQTLGIVWDSIAQRCRLFPLFPQTEVLREGAKRPKTQGIPCVRGVAQPGSASALGAEGRWFESSLPDQCFQRLATHTRRSRWPVCQPVCHFLFSTCSSPGSPCAFGWRPSRSAPPFPGWRAR